MTMSGRFRSSKKKRLLLPHDSLSIDGGALSPQNFITCLLLAASSLSKIRLEVFELTTSVHLLLNTAVLKSTPIVYFAGVLRQKKRKREDYMMTVIG